MACRVLLNFRILLITASIPDVFEGRPFWQVPLAARLAADEKWAVLLARGARGQVAGYRYFVGAEIVQFVAWLAATSAGARLSEAIPDPRRFGLDFAFTAAFKAIAVTLFRGGADIAPWAVSIGIVLVFLATGWLPTPWALVFCGLSGAAAAMTSAWIALAPLALITFAIRLSGARLGRRVPTRAGWAREMRALPGCLIASLVAAGLAREAPRFGLRPRGRVRGGGHTQPAARHGGGHSGDLGA